MTTAVGLLVCTFGALIVALCLGYAIERMTSTRPPTYHHEP